MKCKVRLFHVESDTKWTVKKEFGYDNKNAGWARQKLLYSKLMKFDTITFRGEVEVISLLDVRGNKTLFNNGKRTFVASMDDANMNKTSPTKKTSFIGRNSRSKTTGNVHQQGPYGGYGSHNYQDYFNDGYKDYNKQREERQKEREKEERERKAQEGSDDDDDDDDEEEEEDAESAEDGSESESEEELQLVTFQDLRNQANFLLKEWKKLNKIVQNLKQKSVANDSKIKQLTSDIAMLKNAAHGQVNEPVVNGTVNVRSNQSTAMASSQAQSMATKNGMNQQNGKNVGSGGDLFDLLNGMNASPPNGQSKTTQSQQNNVAFGTGGDGGGAAVSGWTTF